MKKILQLNTRDQHGGTERIAKTLLLKYRARGYQSWLVVGKKYGQELNVWEMSHASSARSLWSRTWLRFIESLSPLRQRGVLGVAAIQVRLRLLAQPVAWYRRRQGWEDFAYPGTWQLFDQLPDLPDIIHCHNLHGDYFDLRALPWLSRQRPVILHLHDMWLLSGHCAHSLDCERWRTGCGQCPYLDTYPAIVRDNSAANWEVKQNIYANSHLYIVTVSQWLMDQVQSSMLRGVQQRVIHNGIDLKIFKPGDQQAARRALDLPSQTSIVLYSAHSGFKDYATMNAALERLTGTNLLFVCIGKRGAVQRLGQGQLIRTGYIHSAHQMAQYYRAASLYLHSTKADSFPNSVLESQACGTPVIATAVGGILEQIIDGQTGFLVPPNAPQHMTSVIQSLLDDDTLCTRMGRAAAAHTKQYFGLDRQVDSFLAWYDEISANWQKGGTFAS